ncbi:MAG: hypothetical protein K2W97_09175 [Chthoniobacterales bacterium]|nr:hypothetical protein [Chthoniobacterales bacterium]
MNIMNKSDVLECLPRLNSHDRLEIFSFLCAFEEEKDFFETSVPTVEEKQLLDRELEAYQKDLDDGVPWDEVMVSLLKK